MKWEYKVLKIDNVSFWGGLKVDDDTLELEMNKLGEQGWPILSGGLPRRSNLTFFNRPASTSPPKHAVEVRKGLQKFGSLETDPADTRKGSFYLKWKCCCRRVVKARFRIKR